MADGTPGIEFVNFIAHKYMLEKLIDAGRINKGGAIGMISSVAGLGWDAAVYEELVEYINLPSWEAMGDYFKDHPDRAGYGWAKQAMCLYTESKAYEFGKKGIRINSILPGPTDTPLARANADLWLGFAADYRAELGIPASTPEQQAYPLVFLCSQAADHISGINIIVDAGYVSAGYTNTYAPASFIRMMMGR
ncbi:MAG: SDR family oxidoreductase [Acidimicrobiia bacterium]